MSTEPTPPEPAKPLPPDTLRLLAMVSHAYSVLKTYNAKMDLGRALKSHLANLNRDASTAHCAEKAAKEAAKKQKKAKPNDVEQEATA